VLAVRLLGPVEVGPEDQKISLTEPARKFVAALALEPHQYLDREMLAGRLWGGADQNHLDSLRRGRRTLEKALHDLGAASHLRGDGQRGKVRWALYDIESDVQRFRVLAAGEEYAEALALVRGRPLVDAIGQSPTRWLDSKVRALVRDVDEAMEKLAEAHARDRAHDLAIDLHRRRLEIDPGSQRALRSLVLAVETRDGARAALDELAAFPRHDYDAETAELVERLERGGTARARPRPGRGPSQTFLGGDEPDPVLNRALTEDLKQSRIYYFRGATAKHMPDRLRAHGSRLDIARVLMVDPESDHSLEQRARDLVQNRQESGMTIEREIERIRAEIFSALVGLFDCRRVCPIEVGLVDSTSVDRIELFDGAVYISQFHAESSRGHVYPETTRFEPSAGWYSQVRVDFTRRLMQLPRRKRATFYPDQTDDDLLAWLGDDFGGRTLGEWREVVAARSRAFAGKLIIE
jgi:DNA-binding SARP family transcriptional activator